MPHIVQRWTVLCLSGHGVFEVFSSPDKANILATEMTRRSAVKNEGRPVDDQCAYTVIEMYITVMDSNEARAAINAVSDVKKAEKLN